MLKTQVVYFFIMNNQYIKQNCNWSLSVHKRNMRKMFVHDYLKNGLTNLDAVFTIVFWQVFKYFQQLFIYKYYLWNISKRMVNK